MQLTILIIVIFVILYIIYNLFKKKTPIPQPELDIDRKILQEHVVFYHQKTIIRMLVLLECHWVLIGW